MSLKYDSLGRVGLVLYDGLLIFNILPVFLFSFLTCKADRNLSGCEPKDQAIKAFQEHGSQTVHELLDQYILTLVPAGVLSFSDSFTPIDKLFTKVYYYCYPLALNL